MKPPALGIRRLENPNYMVKREDAICPMIYESVLAMILARCFFCIGIAGSLCMGMDNPIKTSPKRVGNGVVAGAHMGA
jgi:hypothetical protein